MTTERQRQMRWGGTKPTTIKDIRKVLIADSIERKKLVDKLIALVREDERQRQGL